LRVFLLDPSRAYYQRQLEAATGLPLRAVQRELERLTGAGLLYRREEGNRTYFQVDCDFPFFPELRSMVLKAAGPVDGLRAALAQDAQVRLAFLNATQDTVLVVLGPAARPTLAQAARSGVRVESMTSDAFLEALEAAPETLYTYLATGWDLLGRRDDVIWRRIESAGYHVRKGAGVP